MTRYRKHVTALLPFAAVLGAASPAMAGKFGALNKDYGGNLNMMLFTPDTPAAKPAILVAIHYCSGHASNVDGWFNAAADKNGFYIIAPDAGQNCFDSSATRAGDRADIVKMVQYVITQKNADKDRVFAAGFSSGGCMTNTLLAIYPDVFKGGSALPGFPAGAWPANDHMCSLCSQTTQPTQKTAQQWGDIARNAFAYTGTRPCVQEWVGGMDQYNFNLWLPSVVAQFSNLGNLDGGSPGTGAPSGWTRTVYKDTSGNIRLETNLLPGQMHDLTGLNLFGNVVSFLGLDKPTGACGLATTDSGGSGSGGASGTAGGSSTGGAPSGSAGASAAAGSSSGGASSTGGAPGAAGAPGVAGAATSSGGAFASAGAAPTGTSGAATAAAGAPATGTAGGGDSNNTDSGCGCSLAGVGTASNRSSLAALIGFVACVGAARRRQRSARA